MLRADRRADDALDWWIALNVSYAVHNMSCYVRSMWHVKTFMCCVLVGLLLSQILPLRCLLAHCGGEGGRRWRQERERKDNIQPKPQEGGEEDSNLVPWDGFETMKGIITEGRERERGKKKNHAKKMDGRGKLNRVSR